jgi:hypothetical protein
MSNPLPYPYAISHEDAWKLFEKPVIKPVEGKVSKSGPVDRMPPRGAMLSVRKHSPVWIDLCWWNGQYWQYVASRRWMAVKCV